MIPENKRKLSIKDPKLFTEYFPIEQRETIRTHLKPWVETYLQISEVPDQVAGVMKSLDECNIHLDLNLNLFLDHLTSYSERRYSFNFIPIKTPIDLAAASVTQSTKRRDHHDAAADFAKLKVTLPRAREFEQQEIEQLGT